MQTLTLDQFPQDDLVGSVVTIGNYDGVHIGHQALINTAVTKARLLQLKSVVMTFHPHPAVFFRSQNIPATISSNAYKQQLIARLGVDFLLTVAFDEQLASLSPEQYVQEILLKKLNTRMVCVGYDFTFGKGRSGNIRALLELAEKYDIETHILEPQRIGRNVVSSTRIRALLKNTQVDEAATLMGRCHVLHGKVIRGDGRGKLMGFPTINMNVVGELIPGAGIYSGLVNVKNEIHAAAIYIGTKPTHGGTEQRVEAHLLNFSGDLYNQTATAAFIRLKRHEATFSSERALIAQIDQDCLAIQQDVDQYLKHPAPIIVW